MPKILVIYSKINEQLGTKQKDLCIEELIEKGYTEIETLGTSAGSKELPQIISIIHEHHVRNHTQAPDAYIALGLVNTDNKSHAKSIKKEVIPFFRKLKMMDNLIIGDGILYSPAKEFYALLMSENPCENMYGSAVNAVHALLKIKFNYKIGAQSESKPTPSVCLTPPSLKRFM